MGLKDRDYMKRENRKPHNLKYFQEPEKASIGKMIFLSVMVLTGLFLIMQQAIGSEEKETFSKSPGMVGLPLMLYFGNKLRRTKWKK